MIYNTIYHEIRVANGLSLIDYCLLESIYLLSTNPKARYTNWCNAPKETFKYLGTGRTITNRLNSLEKNGWIRFKSNKRLLKQTTEKFFENVYSYVLGVKKFHGEKVSRLGVKKFHANGEKVSPNKNNKNIENIILEKEEAEIEEVVLETKNEEEENKKSCAEKIKELLTPANGNYFQFQIAFQELSKITTYDANGFPQHWTDELKLAFVDWCSVFCLVKKNRWGFRPQILDEFIQINEYLLKYTAEEIADCLKYAKSKSNSNYKPDWTLKKVEKQNQNKTKKKSGKRATNYDKVRNQLSDPNFLNLG